MIVCKRHGTEHVAFEPCPACVAEIVAMGPEAFDALNPSATPLGPTPPANAGGELAERAIEAIKAAFGQEFADEEHWPQVTLVVSLPPDGEVVVASTEAEPKWILGALKMGWGAVHRSIRLAPRNN